MLRQVRFGSHLLWALACLFAMVFAGTAFAADTPTKKISVASKTATPDRMNKKSAADAAIGKKCLSCHDQDSDPGIFVEWKKSTHAAKNVDCYDCHKAKEGEKAAF